MINTQSSTFYLARNLHRCLSTTHVASPNPQTTSIMHLNTHSKYHLATHGTPRYHLAPRAPSMAHWREVHARAADPGMAMITSRQDEVCTQAVRVRNVQGGHL